MCKESNKKYMCLWKNIWLVELEHVLVCTCKTKDGNKRTCKDGPVFDG